MAPQPARKSIPKDKISSAFAQAKTQSYYDPVSRGPGSHTIRTIAWSPQGHLIATGSVDKTLRIWNPDKPQVKYSTELRGHTGSVEKVAWNPVKEAELASVSADGTCRFWDVRSRTCIQTVNVGGEAITIAWAGDGSMVIVGRKDDVLVPISVPSYTVHPHEQQTLQTNQIIFAPLLPDATTHTLLITTGSGSVKICSYPRNAPAAAAAAAAASSASSASTSLGAGNATNGANGGSTPRATTPNPPAPAPAAAAAGATTSSTTTATSTSSSSSPSLLSLQHTLSSHTSSCFCVELGPTGRWLATGGSDALICLWDTGEWVCRRSLDRMVGSVRALGFSFDGAYVVGGSDEGAGLDVAHVESGEYVCSLPTPTPAPCVAWHPARYWLAYSGDTGGLRIVGAAGGPL